MTAEGGKGVKRPSAVAGLVPIIHVFVRRRGKGAIHLVLNFEIS